MLSLLFESLKNYKKKFFLKYKVHLIYIPSFNALRSYLGKIWPPKGKEIGTGPLYRFREII